MDLFGIGRRMAARQELAAARDAVVDSAGGIVDEAPATIDDALFRVDGSIDTARSLAGSAGAADPHAYAAEIDDASAATLDAYRALREARGFPATGSTHDALTTARDQLRDGWRLLTDASATAEAGDRVGAGRLLATADAALGSARSSTYRAREYADPELAADPRIMYVDDAGQRFGIGEELVASRVSQETRAAEAAAARADEVDEAARRRWDEDAGLGTSGDTVDGPRASRSLDLPPPRFDVTRVHAHLEPVGEIGEDGIHALQVRRAGIEVKDGGTFRMDGSIWDARRFEGSYDDAVQATIDRARESGGWAVSAKLDDGAYVIGLHHPDQALTEHQLELLGTWLVEGKLRPSGHLHVVVPVAPHAIRY